MGDFHDRCFPGESAQYRAQRDRLLSAEIALRRQVEEVATLRRHLPRGGHLKEDYIFDEAAKGAGGDAASRKTRFSSLFEEDKPSLVLYSFMFAPGAAFPCPMCTAFVDSLNAAAIHLAQRINVAVCAKVPVAEFWHFAEGRGWTNLRILSSYGNSFNENYHSQRSLESQIPLLHVFHEFPDGIHHFYSTELQFLSPDPGQDPRHLDMMWPLWNVLDVVPEGRGTNWYPRICYASRAE